MMGESVQYQGRIVEKDHFRVFVYGFEGQEKLVESYLQYEEAMATGLWFANKDEVEAQQIEMNKEEPIINCAGGFEVEENIYEEVSKEQQEKLKMMGEKNKRK